MPRDKERPGYVLMVATLVCVACALLVSGAVVLLRPVQDRNALLQRQQNILQIRIHHNLLQPFCFRLRQFWDLHIHKKLYWRHLIGSRKSPPIPT